MATKKKTKKSAAEREPTNETELALASEKKARAKRSSQSNGTTKLRPQASVKKSKGERVKVRATRQAYYGNRLRQPGSVFYITKKGDTLPSWAIDADEPYTEEVAEDAPRKSSNTSKATLEPPDVVPDADDSDDDEGDVL